MINDELITQLVEKYGSPLYIYNEQEIINNIQNLKNLCNLPNFKINYAVKANSNMTILRIIKENGLKVDATGYGEVYVNLQAGFDKSQIYVVGNNLSKSELKQLVDNSIIISIDSLDQLQTLAEIAPNYQYVMLRLNPSFGAGANERVITGGVNTKFAIDYDDINQALGIIKKYNMRLYGVNQHIGSAYLEAESLLASVNSLLSVIKQYSLNDLHIINFGGGFGVNYERRHNDLKMDFTHLNVKLTKTFANFLADYPNNNVSLEFEPGRYIVATSAILVGEVCSLKKRGNKNIVGTNLGFNNMIRPTLYDAYHEIEVITSNSEQIVADVVGNVCESGDHMCKGQVITRPNRGDLLVVHDVGAYGYSMASNYNSRPKPAEIMIMKDGSYKQIRARQSYQQLIEE